MSKKDKQTGQLFPTDKSYLLINYLIGNELSSPICRDYQGQISKSDSNS